MTKAKETESFFWSTSISRRKPLNMVSIISIAVSTSFMTDCIPASKPRVVCELQSNCPAGFSLVKASAHSFTMPLLWFVESVMCRSTPSYNSSADLSEAAVRISKSVFMLSAMFFVVYDDKDKVGSGKYLSRLM